MGRHFKKRRSTSKSTCYHCRRTVNRSSTMQVRREDSKGKISRVRVCVREPGTFSSSGFNYFRVVPPSKKQWRLLSRVRAGAKVKELAKEDGVSEQYIRQIVPQAKRQELATVRRELMMLTWQLYRHRSA